MLSLFHDDLTSISLISALLFFLLPVIIFWIIAAYYFGYHRKIRTYKIKLLDANGFYVALAATLLVSLFASRILYAKYELGMIMKLPPNSVLVAYEPQLPNAVE